MQAEWWVNADSVRDHHASQCQKLGIRAGEIRAEVNRLMGQPRNRESVDAIRDVMRQAQELDFECVRWAEAAPEDFRYRTILWQDDIPDVDYYQLEVFPGRVDAYPDLWVASLWGMMRVTRIILASLVIRCVAWICSPVDYRTAPEYAAARRICVESITDIIASVPYQLGWFSTRKHLFQQDGLTGFACGEDDSSKSLAGYFLTWPLACIQGQDYVTDNQRAWARGRLVYIGKQLGVSYALMLTQVSSHSLQLLIVMYNGWLTVGIANAAQLPDSVHAHPDGRPHGQQPVRQRRKAPLHEGREAVRGALHRAHGAAALPAAAPGPVDRIGTFEANRRCERSM